MGGWVVGGPSNFIVNQSPNPWILGFEILDLDFGLDNIELFLPVLYNSLKWQIDLEKFCSLFIEGGGIPKEIVANSLFSPKYSQKVVKTFKVAYQSTFLISQSTFYVFS